MKTALPRTPMTLRLLVVLSILLVNAPRVLLADDVKLTILHTTDMHARILADDRDAGLLNLSTAIHHRMEELPKGRPVLLVDCGDTMQGSLIGQISKGKVAIDMLNELKYDVWVVGNHDFDFGVEALLANVAYFKGSALAANLKIRSGRKTVHKIKPWVLLTKHNTRIAVIGMTFPFLQNWLWGDSLKSIEVSYVDQKLKTVIPEVMKSKPDLIVLAIHQGEFPLLQKRSDNLVDLARKYPQIDLILGGHTHQEVPGHRIGRRTWYVQAGCHANVVGEVDITFDTGAHRISSISSSLIQVRKTRSSARIPESVRKWLKRAKMTASKVIGSTRHKLSPARPGEINSGVNQLFCRAICAAAKVDIAFHGTVRPEVYLHGQITEDDLFRLVPYEDTIGILSLNEEELRYVIAEQFERIDKGRFQSLYGLQAEADDGGNVTGSIRLPDRKVLKSDRRYKVAFSSYALAGGGSRFPYLRSLGKASRCEPKDTGILVRDALRRFITRNSPLKINEKYGLKQVETVENDSKPANVKTHRKSPRYDQRKRKMPKSI